jgi:hypothetical protein
MLNFVAKKKFLSQKKEFAGRVAQVVEHLVSKH